MLESRRPAIAGHLFNMRHFIYIALTLCFLSHSSAAQQLSDPEATRKTQNLYSFLSSVSKETVLFGHQDDILYGLDWKGDYRNSDVKSLVGDYPVVFGWDIGKLGHEYNLDTVAFDQIIKGIKHVYKMGGINTISWHMENPVNGNSSWDKEADIKALLPGGKSHQDYLNKLDLFDKFIKECKVGFTKIPIILRPFHEHNGDWFWWGKPYSDEEDYIKLWRFTVDYLRNEKNIHNLIYAFSPDRSRLSMDNAWEDYHYGYPGDDYVDVIGLDNYWDMGYPMNRESDAAQYKYYGESIKLITDIASKRNKIAALTETGNEKLKIPNWYTERLLDPIISTDTNLAWVLVWRNAHLGHFYVPYSGHPNETDFKKFGKHKGTLFLADINNPYKKSK